jgi:hypothetical protein
LSKKETITNGIYLALFKKETIIAAIPQGKYHANMKYRP